MSELALQLIAENKATRNPFLDLGKCGFTELPVELGELTHLEVLLLSDFYWEWNEENKRNEKKESENKGESNHLSDISVLASLGNLKTLYCQGGEEKGKNWKIQDISPLAALTNLQILWLSYNQIVDTSPLTALTSLSELYLHNNQIVDISPLAALTNLQTLYLDNNQIVAISSLLNLYKKGIIIGISNNSLIHPPIEVVNRGKHSIIAYLETLTNGEELHFLREGKVVIVGEGGSGKTSLLRKIQGKELPKETERTKGIEIASLHFQDKDKQEYQMNIWDFGGQGIYQTTHQLFLSKRSIYILLDDTRRSDTTFHHPTFHYWLQVLELYGGDSPLLIVQNEKEDFSKQINFADMQKRFGFVKGLYATNLQKKNKDWDRLMADIQEYVRQLPHIGIWMRKEWLEIRAVLNEKRETENFISMEEYEKICQEKGIDKESEMLMLSGLLHDLGGILHFQDSIWLKQRLILKKEWVTDAIYKVLDSEVIKQEKKGRFTEHDLERLWCDKQWKNAIPQLLALMDKFEVCYPLTDTKEKTYLVPLLLPVANPQYEWDRKENLVLRYKYRFMPQGILSRLIVRLHRYIKDPNYVWKTGVLLWQDEQTKAEITEVYGEGEIRIAVSGAEKKEFMHTIHSEMDALNETYPFQDYPDKAKAIEKLIPCVCASCQKAENPHYYEYEKLKRRKDNNKATIECEISYEDVPLIEILGYWNNIDTKLNTILSNTFKAFELNINSLEEGGKNE